MTESVRAICFLAADAAPTCQLGMRIVSVSFPYLFVLHQVMKMEVAAGVVGRQLMIVETTGFGAERSLNLGIASEIHRVDRDRPWCS
jgi:hypothetical protein